MEYRRWIVHTVEFTYGEYTYGEVYIRCKIDMVKCIDGGLRVYCTHGGRV